MTIVSFFCNQFRDTQPKCEFNVQFFHFDEHGHVKRILMNANLKLNKKLYSSIFFVFVVAGNAKIFFFIMPLVWDFSFFSNEIFYVTFTYIPYTLYNLTYKYANERKKKSRKKYTICFCSRYKSMKDQKSKKKKVKRTERMQSMVCGEKKKRVPRIWIWIKLQEKNFKYFFINEMRFHWIRTHIWKTKYHIRNNSNKGRRRGSREKKKTI